MIIPSCQSREHHDCSEVSSQTAAPQRLTGTASTGEAKPLQFQQLGGHKLITASSHPLCSSRGLTLQYSSAAGQCLPAINPRPLSLHRRSASAGWHRSIGRSGAPQVLEAKPPWPLLCTARRARAGGDWMDLPWPAGSSETERRPLAPLVSRLGPQLPSSPHITSRFEGSERCCASSVGPRQVENVMVRRDKSSSRAARTSLRGGAPDSPGCVDRGWPPWYDSLQPLALVHPSSLYFAPRSSVSTPAHSDQDRVPLLVTSITAQRITHVLPRLSGPCDETKHSGTVISQPSMKHCICSRGGRGRVERRKGRVITRAITSAGHAHASSLPVLPSW
jgi:hypothetical protein